MKIAFFLFKGTLFQGPDGAVQIDSCWWCANLIAGIKLPFVCLGGETLMLDVTLSTQRFLTSNLAEKCAGPEVGQCHNIPCSVVPASML